MVEDDTRPSFREQLQRGWDLGKFVCIGLDPAWDRIPQHLKSKHHNEQGATIHDFVNSIVDATSDLVLAYKPNIAFYEDDDETSLELHDITERTHNLYPDIPIIGDVKRADIGNTNRGYARMAYERYEFDAITTNPYFGGDTFPPFQAYENRGLIVLCRTTNPGAKELQDMPIRPSDAKGDGLITEAEMDELVYFVSQPDDTGEVAVHRSVKVYEMVAFLAARRWNTNDQLGLVVGATHPEAFAPVRRLAGDTYFLIPGIGTQGGDLEKTLKYAPDRKRQGMIINSGSAIIHASSGENFAEAARAATLDLDRKIREGLQIV